MPGPVSPTINCLSYRSSTDFDLRGVIGDAHVRFLGGRPDPRQPGRIEARAGRTGERPERCVARNDAEAAVLRGDIEDVARGGVAAGSRHVLRDDARSAGQMTADMPADGAAPEIIAAARPEADDHRHRLRGKGIAARLRRTGVVSSSNEKIAPPASRARLDLMRFLARGLLASCATFYERSAVTPSRTASPRMGPAGANGSEVERGTERDHPRILSEASVAVQDAGARTKDILDLRLQHPPRRDLGLVDHLDHDLSAPHRIEEVSEQPMSASSPRALSPTRA